MHLPPKGASTSNRGRLQVHRNWKWKLPSASILNHQNFQVHRFWTTKTFRCIDFEPPKLSGASILNHQNVQVHRFWAAQVLGTSIFIFLMEPISYPQNHFLNLVNYGHLIMNNTTALWVAFDLNTKKLLGVFPNCTSLSGVSSAAEPAERH